MREVLECLTPSAASFGARRDLSSYDDRCDQFDFWGSHARWSSVENMKQCASLSIEPLPTITKQFRVFQCFRAWIACIISIRTAR